MNCKLDNFTLAAPEHIINDVAEPFVVRAVKGRARNQDGEWPRGLFVYFEILPYGEEKGIRSAWSDQNGNFHIEDVSPGTYCFKATRDGWQSAMGIIIVSEKADPNETIEFVMYLGV
jgi:hypothetical protein